MAKVGRFRDDDAHARFLQLYQAGMADLPVYDESFDVPTAFGTVRVYRFAGAAGRPVVLLPGRNASTPMWEANLAGLVKHRTVYSVDLLGEPGMSVQQRPFGGPDDQARWLDETLVALTLDSVHLMGVSFGGWSAVNHAVLRPGRAASLTLLDPVMTFAPIPASTMAAFIPMGIPGTPMWLRRRLLRWISGGADVDDAGAVGALIAAGSADFELRQPAPVLFSDAQLRGLRIPVLAFIAGRSVIHDARRAADHARDTLRHGQIHLWDQASHAINGEFPEEIAAVAGRFWDTVDRSEHH